MDLLDVFDLSKTFERVKVPGSQTRGHVVSSDELFSNPSDMKKHIKGRDYVRQYEIQEEQEIIQVSIICTVFLYSKLPPFAWFQRFLYKLKTV
jgi:hypothetical protein